MAAEARQFIYCVTVVGGPEGGVVVSGGGDGALHCHDLASGRLLWGLGAARGAVRAVGATATHLVAAGDDGKAITWAFS